MIKKKPSKSREEINEQSRQLKRKRKHKGLPSGSRIQGADNTSKKNDNVINDPRIGSKKPIPLVANGAVSQTKPHKTKPVTAKPIKLTPEKELEQLENDPYLDQLLDLIDEGETLSNKQQQDLDRMLDRIDALMNQLGLTIEEDEDNEFADDTKEDIVSLLKKQ
ncbi:hypothetical protein DES39_0192 [Orbus hercynius]|uniref:Der GTPase-activating protein YihI n=1 Tax=Orbus hercynius TaxID=593135 RepID=A0A495RIH0_9GAMM|nr:Der GTPase-activating protein YihI [Orbus hercynius]RKS86986.1 hypothetical protein DES39_0192 [Orbus hercynius]